MVTEVVITKLKGRIVYVHTWNYYRRTHDNFMTDIEPLTTGVVLLCMTDTEKKFRTGSDSLYTTGVWLGRYSEITTDVDLGEESGWACNFFTVSITPLYVYASWKK